VRPAGLRSPCDLRDTGSIRRQTCSGRGGQHSRGRQRLHEMSREQHGSCMGPMHGTERQSEQPMCWGAARCAALGQHGQCAAGHTLALGAGKSVPGGETAGPGWGGHPRAGGGVPSRGRPPRARRLLACVLAACTYHITIAVQAQTAQPLAACCLQQQLEHAGVLRRPGSVANHVAHVCVGHPQTAIHPAVPEPSQAGCCCDPCTPGSQRTCSGRLIGAWARLTGQLRFASSSCVSFLRTQYTR